MMATPITAVDLSKVIASALADERVKRHREELSAPNADEEKLIARQAATQHLRMHNGLHVWGFDNDHSHDDALIDEAIAHVLGLGKLQPLLEDPEISDIHVRGNRPVWVKMRSGERVQHPPIAHSDAELIELIRRIATRMGHREQRFDPAHPELNLQMQDGSRLFATMEVSSHPSLVIRRHRFDYSSLGELVSQQMMTSNVAQFLASSVRARCNIVIAGGTGTGKTTLLRALINEVPRTERIVTIEDAFERHPDVIVIDHLNEISGGENKFAAIETYLGKIREMAIRRNVALVVCSQVNRSSRMDDDKKPQLHQIKGCVHPDTIVGGKTIRDRVENNDYSPVPSVDPETGIAYDIEPYRLIRSGVKKCLKIKTKSGKEIILSTDTMLYDGKQWRKSVTFSPKDKILLDIRG
jgi:hypothetical protein